MPISPFQRQVLLLLKKSRNPESYVAGGTAIQRGVESNRYSRDIDFFHDTDEAVTQAFQSDHDTLLKHKYRIDVLISQPSFYRAVISRGREELKLEWVRDTAFRFFPVIEDEDLGYRLHDVDLAVNKCLALANRTEVRDILDILEIHSKVLSLGACVWAGCGKDPGFTPELLLEMMQRHSIVTPDKLAAEALTRPVDPKGLKADFMSAYDEAKAAVSKANPKDLGCVYLDRKGKIIRELSAVTASSIRHYGTVKGSWPKLAK